MSRYRFFKEITVPIYDCDPFVRARASSLLRYIQTVSSEHIDSLGLTHKRLFDEGFVFVVAGTAMKIYRAPVFGEKIKLCTAPLEGSGAHMVRETVIVSESGEKLVECQSDWALIDAKSSRLLKASDFPYELPTLQGEWTPFFDPKKIRIKPAAENVTERPVRLTDLDQNMHMNNTVYADILTDCFGEQYIASGGVDTIFIRYHLQARMGDMLTLEYGEKDGLFTVGPRCGDNRCFEGAFSLKPLETV
jgi:acyl-ACP thioesterase